MKRLTPDEVRDREIISCIKWAARVLSKRLKRYRFHEEREERLEKILQTQDEYENSKKEEPELVGFHHPHLIGKLENGSFIAMLEHSVLFCENYSGGGGERETTGQAESFVLQIRELGKDPSPYIWITLFVSPKSDRKSRIPKGWRKRYPRDSNYSDDQVTPYAPLQILYSPKEGPLFRAIDFMIQAGVFAVQEGFLSNPNCLMSYFRKYVLSTFKELKHSNRSVKPIGYYDETEHKEEERKDRGLRGKISFNPPTASAMKKPSRWSFHLEDIDENILKRALEHIIKKYDRPYNSTTFEVFVRKTIAGKIRDRNKLGNERPDLPMEKILSMAKEKGLSKNKTFSKLRSRFPKFVKAEMISAYQKKKGISRDGARKWYYREDKMGELEKRFIELF